MPDRITPLAVEADQDVHYEMGGVAGKGAGEQALARRLYRRLENDRHAGAARTQLLSRDEAPPAPGATGRATVRCLPAGGQAGRVRFGRRVASIADTGRPQATYRGSRPLSLLAGEPVPGPESSAGPAHVSALTYCTTMTTCPSGPSVTVYQMVRPFDGRWRR